MIKNGKYMCDACGDFNVFIVKDAERLPNYVADMKAICGECAKTHEVSIKPKGEKDLTDSKRFDPRTAQVLRVEYERDDKLHVAAGMLQYENADHIILVNVVEDVDGCPISGVQTTIDKEEIRKAEFGAMESHEQIMSAAAELSSKSTE